MSETSQTYLDESKSEHAIGNDQNALHYLRKSIDAIIQYTEQLKTEEHNFGREIALVHTKLQEAKMWAGKGLEAIGSALPAEFQDKAEIKEHTDPVENADNSLTPDPATGGEEKPAE